MKKLVISIMLSVLIFGQTSAADSESVDELKIIFSAKIYKLTEGRSAQDKDARVLESSPSLITKAGSEASIMISAGEGTDKQGENILLKLKPNQAATHYDALFELENGDNKTISDFEQIAIDAPLNFTAKLKNVTRVISVNAATFNNGSCGRVSIFRSPPQNERFFPVTIYKIDDDNVDNVKTTHMLSVGLHEVAISAQTGKKRHTRGKAIELMVAPNTTYHIGAKFVPEKRYTQEDDWEPVVWKTTNEDCSF
jgi:hypothetical protein